MNDLSYEIVICVHHAFRPSVRPFIKNVFKQLSHIHSEMQYFEKENAEVVQLMNEVSNYLK